MNDVDIAMARDDQESDQPRHRQGHGEQVTAKGEREILPHQPVGAPRLFGGQCQAAQSVALENYIRSNLANIRRRGWRYLNSCRRQIRSVIQPVTNHTSLAARFP